MWFEGFRFVVRSVNCAELGGEGKGGERGEVRFSEKKELEENDGETR